MSLFCLHLQRAVIFISRAVGDIFP